MPKGKGSSDDDREEAGHMEMAPRDVPAIVGSNLRRLRKYQGHSLERLAELSGVSRAMLGQIETGKSVPTVSLLWKVADALGVPVGNLIATQQGSTTVVLSRDGSGPLVSSGGRVERRPLLPLDRSRGTEFYELKFAPHAREDAEPYASGMRENLVVAQGTLRITVGYEPARVLDAGDAILFEADVPRSYENPGETETVAYLVVMHCGRVGA
jgi:transcriptional regulator with XRE-family HTH domain